MQFIGDWLSYDHDCLGAPLLSFVGHPACDTRLLRSDLDRFALMLGGSDGRRRQYP